MAQLTVEIRNNQAVIKQILLYGIIGGLAAGIDSGIYYFLTRLYSINEFAANFASVNIGITISFLLNTFINFKMTNKIWLRAISFYSVGYLGLALSSFILYVGIHVLELNDFVIKISSVFLVALFQFVFNKLVTFGSLN